MAAKPGVVPAHIKIRQEAIAVAASLRPLGSVNRKILEGRNGLIERALVAQHEALEEEVRLAFKESSLSTLGQYHAECSTHMDHISPRAPFLVCPCPISPDGYRLVKIKDVDDKLRKVGSTQQPRVMCSIEGEGDAMLPSATWVVFQ